MPFRCSSMAKLRPATPAPVMSTRRRSLSPVAMCSSTVRMMFPREYWTARSKAVLRLTGPGSPRCYHALMTRQTGTLEPARRRKLLASAAAEFIEFGYQKASLNRIIGMHRMSKSSFYHYFESKAALFDAVVDEAAARLSEQLIVPRPADLAGPHYWDRIEAAVDRLARMRDESVLGLAWLFYLPDAPQGGAPDRIRGAIDRWIDAALMAGRVCGAVRDDLPATLQARMVTAVLWAMDEWTVSHMTEADARQVADLGASQVDAVRRLLAP